MKTLKYLLIFVIFLLSRSLPAQIIYSDFPDENLVFPSIPDVGNLSNVYEFYFDTDSIVNL